jgi:hypothetical protein
VKDGVPIKLILNANPVFVRGEDVHKGLEALANDIRQFGLQTRVLLDPDYQIIDGARRVLACKLLGMTHIPAVSTRDWPTIRDHMLATRKVEENIGIMPMPYRWTQLADWYNRVLKPFALPYERERANKTRKAKLPKSTNHYSQTLIEITEMTGHGLNESKMSDILRVASTLTAIKNEVPELYESSVAYAERAEAMGEAATRAVLQLRKFLAERNVAGTTTDRKVADQQIALIAKAASLLAVISGELAFELNPALTEQEAKNLFKLIHPHVRRLSVLRKRLAQRGKVRASGPITSEPRERTR